VAVKKSEIYSSLWQSCDALRGGMDASLYKDYVLVLLFMKYVSDRFAANPDALIEVPEGGSFSDMLALRGDKDIGEKLNVIIAKLAEANDLKGVIDVADFNDPDKLGGGKEMVDRLSNLVGIFNRPEFSFGKNRADGDDILGDAYEYLMRNFATQSGKSKGQFYTPSEVSRIMAALIGVSKATSPDQTIYDPTCGSGSLLLKAHDQAPFDLTIYGQERDVATRALAKMNMVLHGCPTAEIWRDNTLTSPHFLAENGKLKTFDFVVANPPFSDKAWSQGVDIANDPFDRFADGVPPQKNGDYAFLLHMLASLKSTGKGAVILPHGVLFRGNAEANIRTRLIRKGVIKAIIGLPANLFFGTGIPACIVVLDKENAATRKGIFMIDASKGFIKDGNKNRLREQDIHKIVDTFTSERTVDRYARLVPVTEIASNGFNLNIPRYIDSSEPEDLQDIEAHLKGGIPSRDVDRLGDYWRVMPAVRAALFGPGDRPGYVTPLVEAADVRATIIGQQEFEAYSSSVGTVASEWRNEHSSRLKAIKVGEKPSKIIKDMAEDLLRKFKCVALIANYDLYQHLMNYWAEVMQDDVSVLVQDGWSAARNLRELMKNDEGKFVDEPDLIIGNGRRALRMKAELIPPSLIIERFFAKESASLQALNTKVEAVAQALEDMEADHGGDEGLLYEAKTDKAKLTAKSVKNRLKEIKGDKTADEEHAVLAAYIELLEDEADASGAARIAKEALDAKLVAKYSSLTDTEIKRLLVEDKWLADVQSFIQSELDRVTQGLTGWLGTLTERYAVPLPDLTADVSALSAKVDLHLMQMGFPV
jgi:type I restriction enzyme M protein